MKNTKRKTKGTANQVDVHVGQRLRIRRSLLGLSQEKLAEAIGLTFQQVQKYERGLNRISAGRLFQFSKILDVPVTYFFEQFGNTPENQNFLQGLADHEQQEFLPTDLLQSKETLDLVRSYYNIEDQETRRNINKFVKSMAGKASDDE
ncbi:MAG: helix-turn-helix transcriptional regulator [Alphaproteobacteria bacterium]|nr:helix-turn-helix transcriptional regulator [Alphaproteobacteria bacterium]